MTRRQRDLLRFIERYIADNDGMSPSYDEMRVALGLSSKSSVNRLVRALVERGHITYRPARARSIEITEEAV